MLSSSLYFQFLHPSRFSPLSLLFSHSFSLPKVLSCCLLHSLTVSHTASLSLSFPAFLWLLCSSLSPMSLSTLMKSGMIMNTPIIMKELQVSLPPSQPQTPQRGKEGERKWSESEKRGGERGSMRPDLSACNAEKNDVNVLNKCNNICIFDLLSKTSL